MIKMEYELFTEIFFTPRQFPAFLINGDTMKIFDRHLNFAEKYLTPKFAVPWDSRYYHPFYVPFYVAKEIFANNLSMELYEIANKNLNMRYVVITKYSQSEYGVFYLTCGCIITNSSFDPKKYGVTIN